MKKTVMTAAEFPSLLERLLCRMGFHAWNYDIKHGGRHCRRCPKAQELQRNGDWRDAE